MFHSHFSLCLPFCWRQRLKWHQALIHVHCKQTWFWSWSCWFDNIGSFVDSDSFLNLMNCNFWTLIICCFYCCLIFFMNLYHDIKNLQHSAPLFSYRLLLATTLQNWMFFFTFSLNHLATSSATCTVKIVNKNWRQSVVYGSGGSGGDGGSTELHIHRADTRELTAKSSWFCHLLHVSLVGVVAVRTALAPTNLLQPRTTRGRRGLSNLQAHTLCYALAM